MLTARDASYKVDIKNMHFPNFLLSLLFTTKKSYNRTMFFAFCYHIKESYSNDAVQSMNLRLSTQLS